ncbi:MAG: hypothetical protein LUH03_10115 [Oscillospiraceae bacterium]|nr:hypothetical protein [Oscillospiraceae bacterium]
MDDEKRGRGRPKIDASVASSLASSRRAQLNAKYMFDGVFLLSRAGDKIPDSDLLWHSDDATCTAGGRQGILEQIGRMLEQDHIAEEDCIYIASLSAQAVKVGHTTREVEKAIRAIRKTTKELATNPEDAECRRKAIAAVEELERMAQ